MKDRLGPGLHIQRSRENNEGVDVISDVSSYQQQVLLETPFLPYYLIQHERLARMRVSRYDQSFNMRQHIRLW